MQDRREALLLPLLLGAMVLVAWSLAVRWSGTRVFPAPINPTRMSGRSRIKCSAGSDSTRGCSV